MGECKRARLGTGFPTTTFLDCTLHYASNRRSTVIRRTAHSPLASGFRESLSSSCGSSQPAPCSCAPVLPRIAADPQMRASPSSRGALSHVVLQPA
jgi:hypothetical protein